MLIPISLIISSSAVEIASWQIGQIRYRLPTLLWLGWSCALYCVASGLCSVGCRACFCTPTALEEARKGWNFPEAFTTSDIL